MKARVDKNSLNPRAKKNDTNSPNPRAEKNSGFGLLEVVILIVCVILVAGGVSLAKWQLSKDIFRDERIAGYEETTIEVNGSERSTTLFRLREGASADDAYGFLEALNRHDYDATGDERIGEYQLATSDGRILWSLDQDFRLNSNKIEDIGMAFWLADQNKPMTWSFSRRQDRSIVSTSIEEGYKDLSFMDEVMTKFPMHRVSVGYDDAPRVNLPAGQNFMLSEVEKLIAAWSGDPVKYGDISRFYVPDFRREGGFFVDERDDEHERVQFNIWMKVSDQDPARVGQGDAGATEEERKKEKERWSEIAELLVKEGETLIPYAEIRF